MARLAGRATLATLLTLAPTVELAHVGASQTTGFMHGLAHPLSGPDHIPAMVMVGVFA